MILRIRQPWFLAIALTLALAAGTSCNSGYKGNSTGYPTSPGPGTPKELNSGDFGAGAHYCTGAPLARTYPYHCLHHGPMTGTVEVNANATETPEREHRELHVAVSRRLGQAGRPSRVDQHVDGSHGDE